MKIKDLPPKTFLRNYLIRLPLAVQKKHIGYKEGDPEVTGYITHAWNGGLLLRRPEFLQTLNFLYPIDNIKDIEEFEVIQ